ncbi:MAG: EAL domain-containing protein [Oleiphilaceae bacterium]|nr:EAL domain-containing protein [Oleiphilaceae bacterium]
MQRLAKRFQQFRSKSPLSFRLLGYILLFSSAFSLVASAIQIYTDFRNDVALVERRLSVIETSYASSLSRSIWALDQKLLEIQMEGIMSLPDITHLHLTVLPDSEMIMGELPADTSVIQHQFKLNHDNSERYELGELTVTAGMGRIYSSMRHKMAVILTTEFFKTFFIAILIVWVFRYFITRHLSAMSSYTRQFSLENLDKPLLLDRPDTRINRADELGQVTDAINHMRNRLHQDVKRQANDAVEIRKLSKAIEQSPSSVMICDRSWRIEFVNQKFSQLTGHKPEDVLGKRPGLLSSEDCTKKETSQLWQNIQLQVKRVGVWQGEINSARKNGEQFWEQIIVTPIKDSDGAVSHYLILGEDIGIRKRYEQQLLRQANYDILTGLPNRMLALDRLKLALAHAQREKTMVAVMFLDLDNFKHINDTMGHDAGDSLLIEAARRIASCLRGSSTVARLGGDEFLVILPALVSPEPTEQVANRILENFIPPFRVDGQEVFVTTSIGIAVYPVDSDNSSTLLQHADAAMYQAKNKGKSAFERFAPEMKEVSHERLQIESHLRRALELREFELYFQPIVNTASGTLVGAEALLRWNNPAMGMVMPDKFIPLAEETGLITPIGEWVLLEACEAAMRWENATGLKLSIAVNVSPRQFRDPGFVDMVVSAVERTGISPVRLELEITERLILDNTIETAEILRRLDDYGVRLSVDDFGTGFSALSYLKSYPFDTLKIDKSFIRDVMTQQGDASLVKAIINMAHSLGLTVIAEGVEEEPQTRFLMDNDCDFAQGYFYSRPAPESEFEAWLRHNHRTRF